MGPLKGSLLNVDGWMVGTYRGCYLVWMRRVDVFPLASVCHDCFCLGSFLVQLVIGGLIYGLIERWVVDAAATCF